MPVPPGAALAHPVPRSAVTALVPAGHVGDRRPEVPGAESEAGEVTARARVGRWGPTGGFCRSSHRRRREGTLPVGRRGTAGSLTGGLSLCCCREKELAKVTIKKEDLELIVSRGGSRAGGGVSQTSSAAGVWSLEPCPRRRLVPTGRRCRAAPAAAPWPGPRAVLRPLQGLWLFPCR